MKPAPKQKQKLSLAIADVVGASLHQLAPVGASWRATPPGKTNPNASPPAAQSAQPTTSTASSASQLPQRPARSAGEAVAAGLPQLAPVGASWRAQPVGKTNPPTLSERQLAAARLLAAGLTATEVAARLGMSRMGLLKWRKQPAFLAEVRRMHDVMAYAYGTAVGDAHLARRRSR
jgi:hypothetical protein